MWKILAVMAFTLAAVSLLTAQAVPQHAQKNRIAEKDSSPAAGEKTAPEKADGNSPQSVTVNVQAPASTAEKDTAAAEENLDIQRKLELFTGVLALVGIFQFCTMFWQARLLRQTLKAIQRQADTMDRQASEARESARYSTEIARRSAEAAVDAVKLSGDQLRIFDAQLRQIESQTRPWIGLDIENGFQAGPLAIDGDGNVSATVVITARNFGGYPGQNVFAGVDLIVTDTLNDVRAEEDRIWSSGIPKKAGSVVFPGLSRIRWQWGASVQGATLARFPKGTELLAFIVGCVWYQDQFGMPHYTVFSYQMKQPGSISSTAFQLFPNTVISGQWTESYGFVDPPKERAADEQTEKQKPN